MVDIGFVNKAFVFNSVSGTSTVVPVPEGAAAGHRLFAFVGSIGSSPVLTPPAGSTWLPLGEHGPTSTLKTAVFYRDVTAAAEPASYTWGWSASGRNWGYCLAYSGVDLAVAPTVDKADFTDTPAATPRQAPALGLSAGDWLLTLVGGRENPGTDTAKQWTNSDTADAERLNFYSSNTGTGAKSTAAWWDSGRKLGAGSEQRTITPSVAMGQMHLWAVRLAAQAAPVAPGEGTTWSRMGFPRV
jgi:hypothetical protein